MVMSNQIKKIIKRSIRFIYPRRSYFFKKYIKCFRNLVGFEIGGPSALFARKGLLPIYTVAKCMDNCNFSYRTVWEGDVSLGDTFTFNVFRKPGRQYVEDAINLSGITSDHYDFIVSSHCLEHVANPIKALFEWGRVLKNDGILLLIVPNKSATFDHKRDVTTFSHLVHDFTKNIQENDLSHLDEVLSKHDLLKDSGVSSIEELKERAEHNADNRCMHHHVFNESLAVDIVKYTGFKILATELLYGVHVVVFAQKQVIV